MQTVTVRPAVATVRIDDAKIDCFNYCTETHNTNMVSVKPMRMLSIQYVGLYGRDELS